MQKILFDTGIFDIREKRKKSMKLVKEAAIIFGVTMAGELLYTLLPLPVPAGVYGLFLLLFLLLCGVVKLEQVETVGMFLLDIIDVYKRQGLVKAEHSHTCSSDS